MDAVKSEFDKRVDEIEAYLRLLRLLEEPDLQLHRPGKKSYKYPSIDDTCRKVMRASAFLMLYNLVESTVRAAVTFLYDTLRQEGKSMGELKPEFRKLWVDQRFAQLPAATAHRDTYSELTRKLVDEALDKAVVELSSTRLPISGSLDANLIRSVCTKHGVKLDVHYRAHGGAELETVKTQRNNLAHGNITFSDCGQQFGATDLERITRQTVMFLRGLLRSVERYASTKSYAA